MTTREMIQLNPPKRRKQAITENKKAELDKLGNQVITAQQNVEQLQAIVTSLTAKSAQFTAFLTTANNNKIHALANKNTAQQLVDSIKDLTDNCRIAVMAMDKANSKTKKLSLVMKELISKLIYSAELINKLLNIIIRQKALNGLISDELIDIVGVAGKDANNAVALTLVALESTFASQASNIESTDISALDYLESINLYKKLTGTKIKITGPLTEMGNIETIAFNANSILITRAIEISLKVRGVKMEFEKDDTIYKYSLVYLLDEAYCRAAKAYDDAYNANLQTSQLLSKSTAQLSNAQVKLRSLQAGLAAANAAALAS